MKSMSSVTDRMESRSASFLGHLSVSFLSGSLLWLLSVLRLVSDIHLSAGFILSDKIWYSIRSLIPHSRFRYVSSFRFHLSDYFTFILCSFLGLISQSRLGLCIALGKTKQRMSNSHHRLFYTLLAVYLCPQQDSSAVRPCSIDSLDMYGQASLRMQLAGDRFFSASHSQQHSPSIAGTQQCAQMLTSVYVILGVYREYWEKIH